MSNAPLDVARIQAELAQWHVEHYESIGSTNDRGLEAARQEETCSRLILTEEQSSGRGRGANRWWTSGGSLAFSCVLDPNTLALPAASWPIGSLAVGLAICETLEQHELNLAPLVKWPNDVYLADAKLAGILVETTVQPARLVVGIGMNVNNRPDAIPKDLTRRAVSLAQSQQREFDRTALVIGLAQAVESRLRSTGQNQDAVLGAYRERCFLTGRDIEVETGEKRIQGRCHGIDDQGALQVVENGRTQRIFAGAIVSFSTRPD